MFRVHATKATGVSLPTLLVSALFSVLSGAACNDPTASETTTDIPSGAEIMRDTVETTIVPDVETFAAEAQQILSDADNFCAEPSAAGLTQLQEQWRTLSEAWNAVVPYNFGPLDDDVIVPKMIFIESMRQRGTDYTQTVRDGVLRGLSSDDELDIDYFDRQTFDEVGLLALEVLLFEDSREGNATDLDDILSDFEAAPRKCEFLQGVAALLAADAAEVEQGWTTAFGDSGEAFRDTMTAAALADGTQPIVALLVALQQHLDYIKVRKLDVTLDARISGHFYANVLATVDAMEMLLDQPGEESFGIFDRMRITQDTDAVERVLANFAAVREAAEREDRDALAVAIGDLEGNLKREIPDALGVDLGLTFTDGD